MEKSKLMMPLFYGMNFNREGRRMRAVLEREITDGTATYRLWRGAGKADLEYPSADNDKYILHVEINGYLAPLGMTEYFLISHCGYKAAVEKLYGGKEGRKQHMATLRENGGDEAISAAIEVENKEIQLCGNDHACQADYIRTFLEEHAVTYLTSKENGGKTFPDFIGALVLDDLACCVKLSAVYQALKREEQLALDARIEEEDKAFCETRNNEARLIVDEAIRIIRSGGVLENKKVTFYRSPCSYSTYSIFNYLMRLYKVDVPLRTQGWINEKLSSAIIQDGKCERLHYLRYKNKKRRGSQSFFVYMNELIQAVTAQSLEQVS